MEQKVTLTELGGMEKTVYITYHVNTLVGKLSKSIINLIIFIMAKLISKKRKGKKV